MNIGGHDMGMQMKEVSAPEKPPAPVKMEQVVPWVECLLNPSTKLSA